MSQTATDLMADGSFTVDGAIAFSGIGRNELYKHMQAGDLVYVKHGKRRLIPRRAMVELLASLVPPELAVSSPQIPAGTNRNERPSRKVVA